MLRILDRYIIREVVPPFMLALLIFTFLLMIPPIMEVAEDLIAKGVDGFTILRLMGTLVPQAIGITIPMAFLLGVLMGLGRLSADRESVALQACGVSIVRMVTPLLSCSVRRHAGSRSTSWRWPCRMPTRASARSRSGRSRTARRVRSGPGSSTRTTSPVSSSTSARSRATGDGWFDVFMADTRRSTQPDVYVAERGRVLLDREERRVEVVLSTGTRHQVDPE